MQYHVPFVESEWEASGTSDDPNSRIRLKGGMTIAGSHVHVEAVAIQEITLTSDPNTYIVDSVYPMFSDTIERLSDEIDASPNSVLLTFDGRTRPYIVAAFPSAE